MILEAKPQHDIRHSRRRPVARGFVPRGERDDQVDDRLACF
jgi:hypothetical protein